ncbi:hypothetical protein RchiOBHm_Chr7g0199991 [Rosa chinensis]|uniref:Uncharacterized protein n=1 Tax=Rosa chinensis TaxID=74649 RepID=A0A2P6P7J2_ROSCH|nr:hypothetical protein RchiOBHm_Chr7g0199991 [Rosa chinensis]
MGCSPAFMSKKAGPATTSTTDDSVGWSSGFVLRKGAPKMTSESAGSVIDDDDPVGRVGAGKVLVFNLDSEIGVFGSWGRKSIYIYTQRQVGFQVSHEIN